MMIEHVYVGSQRIRSSYLAGGDGNASEEP
jgi:hypothetical protein